MRIWLRAGVGVQLSNSSRRLLLVILMIFCLISFWGGLPAAAQQMDLRVMVWEWSPEVDEALYVALVEFKEISGINCSVVRAPEGVPYWESLQKHLAGEKPPDVIWINYEMVPDLYKLEQIIELDGLVKAQPEVIEGLSEEALERFRFEDRLYGIPLGEEEPFSLNAYAISLWSERAGQSKAAFELIGFLRTRIPPPSPPQPTEVPPLIAPPVEPIVPPIEPIVPPVEPVAPDRNLPDLSLLEVGWEINEEENELSIIARVENAGAMPSPRTVLYAESLSADWWYGEVAVPELGVGDVTQAIIVLEIPEELRGRSHLFDVGVDAWNDIDEFDDENNWQSAEIWIPEGLEVQDGLDPLMPVIGVVAVAVAAGGTFAVRHSARVKRHREWQEKAEEEKPPDICQPCTRCCRKVELKLETSRREITNLGIGARDPLSGERIKGEKIQGEIVESFNRVITAYRRGENLKKLQEQQIKPLAYDLGQHILEWLRSEAEWWDIFITGHLEGGKATFEFILYHCKRRGDVSVWEEEDKWEATVKQSIDEPVGTISGLDAGEEELPERLAVELSHLLVQFIEKV